MFATGWPALSTHSIQTARSITCLSVLDPVKHVSAQEFRNSTNHSRTTLQESLLIYRAHYSISCPVLARRQSTMRDRPDRAPTARGCCNTRSSTQVCHCYAPWKSGTGPLVPIYLPYPGEEGLRGQQISSWNCKERSSRLLDESPVRRRRFGPRPLTSRESCLLPGERARSRGLKSVPLPASAIGHGLMASLTSVLFPTTERLAPN